MRHLGLDDDEDESEQVGVLTFHSWGFKLNLSGTFPGGRSLQTNEENALLIIILEIEGKF